MSKADNTAEYSDHFRMNASKFFTDFLIRLKSLGCSGPFFRPVASCADARQTSDALNPRDSLQNLGERQLAFSACSPPDSSLKRLPRSNCGGRLNMNRQDPNIHVVESVWRRLKKNIKDAIIRDLQPAKDVKGGGGVKGESKPTAGGTGTTRNH
jgi:hypothetical protein